MKLEINSKIASVGITLVIMGYLFYLQALDSESYISIHQYHLNKTIADITYFGSLFGIVLGIFLIALSFSFVFKIIKQAIKAISSKQSLL